MASKKHLARALAGDKNLRGTKLSKAKLGGANLTGADLTDADLRGADLIAASLNKADLTRANLAGARLVDASLHGANLHSADLTGADLTGADLLRADLSGAKLTNTSLNDACLAGADLRGVNLSGANLILDLHGATLTDANLSHANLTGAWLSDADLTNADLTGANLQRADLDGATLTGANLAGANLTGANLSGSIGYAPAAPVRHRTSGRATGAALKLSAADAPVDPREFKKRFPREFDLLARRGLAGRPFRPEAVAAIQKQLASPVEWAVTKKKYTSDSQRYCSAYNDVLLLNVDLRDSALTERQRAALRKLAEVSRRSGHPHEDGGLFTIGWVRYCAGDSAWLIEEVQSDVQVARTGLKDPDTRTRLDDAGIDQEDFEEALVALAPYTEAFYHDAIGLVFEMAKAEGVEVEMLEYEAKREFGSPRNIYTDLPREMGMTMREGSRVLWGAAQVWAYRPNPARSRSRRRRASR